MPGTEEQYGGIGSPIFEEAGIGMAVVSSAGRILEVNVALGRMLGREAAELRGVALTALCAAGDGDQCFDHLQDVVYGEGGRVEFETRLRKPKGEIFWANLTAVILTGTAKRPLTLLVTALETTAYFETLDQMREDIRSLEQAKERLDDVFDSLAHPLLVIGKDGRISRTNRSCERTFGYEQGGLQGRRVEELLPSPYRGRRLVERVFEDRHRSFDGMERSLRLRCRDGRTFPAIVRFSHGRCKEIPGVVCSLRDLTAGSTGEGAPDADPLTGLPNLLHLRRRLKAILAFDAAGSRQPVLFVGLDRFKYFNESLGQKVGDQLLVQVADRLRGCLGEEAVISRYSGDTFAVIPGDAPAESTSQRILACIARPYPVADQEVFMTASVGITVAEKGSDDADMLLKNAESAMFRAKSVGGGGYRFYSSYMNERATERIRLESQLYPALAREELFLCYQPQIDPLHWRVSGAEALVRWRHPQMGLVEPERFIPLLEETGLIVHVGEWILREACRQGRRWREAFGERFRMAVNISPRQFQDTSFVESVETVLDEEGLDPRALELEITERMLMSDRKHAAETLTRFVDMGVGVAFDDFGTGYSSLDYLKRFPVDTLKVDRHFVGGLPHGHDDAAIVEAICGLGRSLGKRVIAEGVENRSQLELLCRWQCSQVQGYFFTEPLTAEAFAGWCEDFVPCKNIPQEGERN